MTGPTAPGEYPPLPPSGAYHPPPPSHYGAAGGYGPPQSRPTNGMAIVTMVFAFLFAPLGILFGHIALSQIKRSGAEGHPEQGHGLALAGLVISYLLTAFAAMAMTAVVVIAALAVSLTDDLGGLFPSHPSGTAAPPATTLPPFVPPATLGTNCQYPATTESASKPNRPPRTGKVPTAPATVDATLLTSDGVIGLRLDNAKSPCTVNSFVSLAQQGYFDDTPCHRLTTSVALGVLQCGDPTGKGTGGPGYRFPNEYPTNQYRLSDPALQQAVLYPRGTLAMANAGSGTNGSQFFLVYQDSALPPTYTVFGVIDEAGLAVLDGIAVAAVANGTDDGPPKNQVTIESVRLD